MCQRKFRPIKYTRRYSYAKFGTFFWATRYISIFKDSSNAGDTRTRNLYKFLVQVFCMCVTIISNQNICSFVNFTISDLLRQFNNNKRVNILETNVQSYHLILLLCITDSALCNYFNSAKHVETKFEVFINLPLLNFLHPHHQCSC